MMVLTMQHDGGSRRVKSGIAAQAKILIYKEIVKMWALVPKHKTLKYYNIGGKYGKI